MKSIPMICRISRDRLSGSQLVQVELRNVEEGLGRAYWQSIFRTDTELLPMSRPQIRSDQSRRLLSIPSIL